MQLKHRAIQLTLKDDPVGLDYYGLRDSIVLASGGGVFFYRIADNGTPSQLLLYDQAARVSGIRIQQSERAYFATIGRGSVTLWDPKHASAPMVHTLTAANGVTDCQWSKDDPNTFSLTLNTGMISTWDLRSLKRPAQQLFMGKASQKMDWCSSDPRLLAVSSENKYVLLWDTRMLSGSSSGSEKRPVDECYMLLEPENGVSDFCWAEDVLPRSSTSSSSTANPSCPFLWTLSESGSELDLHRICRTDNILHSSLEIHHTTAARNKSRIVAHPHGQGLLVMHQEGAYTKFDFVDSRHHQSIESDQCVARTAQTVIGAHWRQAQHGSYGAADSFHRSFVACTAQGLVHIFDWTKRKHSNSWDDKMLLPKNTKPHCPQYIDSLTLPGQRDNLATAAQKQRNKFSLKRIHSGLGFGSIREESETSPGGSTPNRAVVGPKTFMLLINHELAALDNAVRHGVFEGVRVGVVDQFTRIIVLEVLIPTADNCTINNFNATFNNHFRKEELAEFYIKGAPGRTVDLSIVFSSKTMEFWVTPRISLENKSSCPLEPDVLASISNEISSLVRTRALQRSATHARNDRLSLKPSEQTADPILLQVAKLLSKRVISSWQKKSEELAIGSWKQSQESAALSLAETQREIDDIQSLYLQYVESKAFSVAFPVVSAGVFNGRGELVLFGNAQLSLAETPPRPACEVVSNIPAHAYPVPVACSADAAPSEVPQNNRLVKTHKSFAHVMVSQFIKKATSGAMLSQSGEKQRRRNRCRMRRIISESNAMHGQGERKGDSWSFSDEDDENEDEDEENDNPSTDDADDDEERTPHDEFQEDFDYQPGYDFEENQSTSAVSKTRSSPKKISSKRRVSYSEKREKDGVGALARETSLSDVSGYFVADLELSRHSPQSDINERAERNYVGPVEFTVFEDILAVSQQLGCEYALGPVKKRERPVFADQPQRVAACRVNAQIAQRLVPWDLDLAQFWNLLAVSLDVSTIEDPHGLISWQHSALGQSLFVKLMQFIVDSKSLQLWATTTCVIGNSEAVLNLLSSEQQRSILTQIHPTGTNVPPFKVSTQLRVFLDTMVYTHAHIIQRKGDINKATDIFNRMVSSEQASMKNMLFSLPRDRTDRFDVSICCLFCETPISYRSDGKYSVALMRRDQRASQTSAKGNGSSSTSSSSRSRSARQKVPLSPQPASTATTTVPLQGTPWCLKCNVFGIYCAVCVLPVRCMASVCLRCGHGGHEHDLAMWFERHEECPSGCGCLCRSEQTEPNPDEEVVFFEDDDSEYMSLSAEHNFGSSSNNNIAAYQNNSNTRGIGKQAVSMFRTFSKHRLGQPDYFVSSYSGNPFSSHNFDNFFGDEM